MDTLCRAKQDRVRLWSSLLLETPVLHQVLVSSSSSRDPAAMRKEVTALPGAPGSAPQEAPRGFRGEAAQHPSHGPAPRSLGEQQTVLSRLQRLHNGDSLIHPTSCSIREIIFKSRKF